MKLFSIKNLLGIGAIYGGWKYAQKHGGVKQAFNGLLDKVKTAADQRSESLDASGGGASLGSDVEVGSTIGSGYAGGVGGSTGGSGTYGGGYSGGGGGGYSGGGGGYSGGGGSGSGNPRG